MLYTRARIKGVEPGTAHISYYCDTVVEHGAMSLPLKLIYMINLNNLEGLIQGIESFISRNRSSISDKDVVLLQQCVNVLKNSQKHGVNIDCVNKIAQLLMNFLGIVGQIKDYFC